MGSITAHRIVSRNTGEVLSDMGKTFAERLALKEFWSDFDKDHVVVEAARVVFQDYEGNKELVVTLESLDCDDDVALIAHAKRQLMLECEFDLDRSAFSAAVHVERFMGSKWVGAMPPVARSEGLE
jgi:hypothetical protein